LLNGLLIPNFAAFRLRHPTITPALHNLRTEEITQRLIDGRLDIGLLRQDAVRPPLKSARLGSIEYRLVAPLASPILSSDKAVWKMLAQHPLAVLAESEISAAIEAEAEKKSVRLTVCLRSSSYSQLAEAVRQTACTAVLPTFAARMLESSNQIVSFSVLKAFTRPIAIAWNPRSCALRPAFPSLIESLTLLLRQKLGSSGSP
jgi:DNA-binding transcriptional LysR family regulator